VHRVAVVRFEEVLAAVTVMGAAGVSVVAGPGQGPVEVSDMQADQLFTEVQTLDTNGVTGRPIRVPNSICSGPKPNRFGGHWMI
jgi:hypothetical protein